MLLQEGCCAGIKYKLSKQLKQVKLWGYNKITILNARGPTKSYLDRDGGDVKKWAHLNFTVIEIMAGIKPKSFLKVISFLPQEDQAAAYNESGVG